MPDIGLLLKIQNCKLWSGLVKPLEGIKLEGVEYISPEMEKELGYREEFAIESWKKVQEELEEAGVLEETVLEWAAKVEEIAAKEHYFADGKNVRVVKRQQAFNIHHTGNTYCYISPLLARERYREISVLVPTSALRHDKEFLANLEILEKEYKPEYSRGHKEGCNASPVFDKKSIDKMLSDNALVEAEKLRKNASELVKDLQHHKAAYERRQMFREEVMKRSKTRNIEYAPEKYDVAKEWYNAFVQKVYERIKNDEGICRLINGQSAGKFWTSWRTKILHFDPKLTNEYNNKTLSLEALNRWLDSYNADLTMRFALQGLDPKTGLLGRIGDRLQQQYCHKDNSGERFISEHDYFDVFPAAAKRLADTFDDELLRFSPKTSS